jgi:hypothetical protein
MATLSILRAAADSTCTAESDPGPLLAVRIVYLP